MSQTTVSTKYQVVIPKDVREQAKIRPGQKLAVLVSGNVIRLIPVRPIKEYRGFLKGMNTSDVRDHEDRF